MTSYPSHPAAELFTILEGEQLQELADDIAANGLLEPVWLYDDPELGTVLLDGRNRARACELAGVELRARHYRGDDPVTFSISQNLKRRHLTTGQKAAVAHEALPLFEAEARKRQQQAGQDHGRGGKVEADRPEPIETPGPRPRAPQARDKAAKTTGTSGRSVARFKRIAEQAPDLADKVKAGSLALDRAERIIRDREAEAKRVAEAKAQAEAQPIELRVDLRHGDFREVLADLTDVDAIITDPPYPAEYLPLLDDLAAWADKVLAEDGILAVLMGQTHLPDVYRRLDGHRPYRWTACYLTTGPAYVSRLARLQSQWKPLLVYGGGPRFSDVIRSEGSDAAAKHNHRWGQDYGAFHTIIERLTKPGQTVCDPLMGSGTTLLAAHSLGRHAIGCDLDEDAYRSAVERLR